jgi:hypothetical protein
MTMLRKIAQKDSQTMPITSDRYDQIWAIKQELKANGFNLLATDRETIDDVLDILFDEYAFNG